MIAELKSWLVIFGAICIDRDFKPGVRLVDWIFSKSERLRHA